MPTFDDEDSIQDALTRAPENRPPGGYFPRSTEPDSWALRGRAVRLDVAVLALRLLTFKVVTRTYPSIYRQKVSTMKGKLLEAGAKFVIGKAAKALSKELLGWVQFFFDLWNAAKGQKELERLIRAQALVLQRQLRDQALPIARRRRHRKIVCSRHRPKQRLTRG